MTKRFCDTEIWEKDWYLKLSVKQKLLVKFLFDKCDCAGIYKISYYTLRFCFDEEIKKEDFEGIKQVIFINDDTIFIEDFVLFQCSIDSLKDLNPNNNAHKGIIKRLEKYNLLGASEPLVSPSLGAQDKEKEKEKEKINTTNSTKFIKPSIEEIKSYCLERKNNVNPYQFFDFYESKNWFVGKNKMKDWQAAVRTWERNCKGKTEIESGNSNRYETGAANRIIAMRHEKIDEVASEQARQRCALKVAQIRRSNG